MSIGRAYARPVAKLLLLDGNSLTYRAFFALPTDMATASGQVTNAVFGFTSMLINLVRDQRPDGVVVLFDRPEPTFRHDAVPEYKAQREAAPDILRQQMGLVREVVTGLGIAVADLEGYEADDLIATLATRAREVGHDVVIVTGDRDTYQLVEDPHIAVLYNRRGVSDYVLYDEAGIKERTGVTPAQYPEYAALRGDPSDNLAGVPGVGEKTAAKLITTYGGLDGIFENVAAQTPKLRESLAANEARVRKNAEVMVLRRDAPFDLDLSDLDAYAVRPPDLGEVKRLFEFLEFRSLFERLAEVLDAPIVASRAAEGRLTADVTPLDITGAVAALHRARGRRRADRPRAVVGGRARAQRGTGHRAGHPRQHRRALAALRGARARRRAGRVRRAHRERRSGHSRARREVAHARASRDRTSTSTGCGSTRSSPPISSIPQSLVTRSATFSCGTPGSSSAAMGTNEMQLDLDGSDVDESTNAALEAVAIARLAPALELALDHQGMRGALRHDREPACARARPDGAGGRGGERPRARAR